MGNYSLFEKLMMLFSDFVYDKKNEKNAKNSSSEKTIIFKNKNIVYPKYNYEYNIEYDLDDSNADIEFENAMKESTQAALKKCVSKEHLISNSYKSTKDYEDNKFIKNTVAKSTEKKYVYKQQTSYFSKKERYKELEDKFNILMKNSDIFVKD